MVVYSTHDNVVEGFHASSTLSIMKDEEASIEVKDAVARKDGDALMDHNGTNALFQDDNFLDWDRILHTAKSGDTLMTSMDISLCPTEAPHTASRPTSSALSAVPAPQNTSASVLPCRNDAQKNLPLNMGDFVGSISNRHFDSIFFSGSEDDLLEGGVGINSVGQKEPSGRLSNDYDKTISELNVTPHSESVGIYETKMINLDAIDGHIEGCSQNQNETVKNMFIIPPSPAESFLNETRACITSKNDEEVISVVDPQRPKLHVPISAVFPTRALGARAQHPSLCLLFQSGCCRQGANCHQVHVSPDVVKRLREIVASFPCCCMLHGDCNAKQWDAKGYVKDQIVVDNVLVPFDRLAFTSGLSRFVANAMRHPLSCDVLCRLHGKPGGCRYGADCWYLHVCREILVKDFACVIEFNEADTNTSLHHVSQKKDGIRPRQRCTSQSQEQKMQQNLCAPTYQPLIVPVNNLPVKDNLNTNRQGSNGVDHCDQPVVVALPYMWMDNVSSTLPKVDPAALGMAVGGCGGVPTGGVVHGKFASGAATRGAVSFPCNVPHDQPIPLLPGHFPNQNNVFFPVETTNAKTHNPPFFPSCYVVNQPQVSGMAPIGPVFPLPVEQRQIWLAPPQQGQQAFMLTHNCGATGSPAFVVSRPMY